MIALDATSTRRRLLVLVSLGALIVVLATAFLYDLILRPHTTSHVEGPVDAIVVLGGTPYERYVRGRELAEAGVASNLVMSTPKDKFPRMQQLCQDLDRVEVSCFVADPWNTRGEAQEIKRLAATHGWDDIIVITQRAHISRAQTIIERCYTGGLQMVLAGERPGKLMLLRDFIYQTGAWFKVMVYSKC